MHTPPKTHGPGALVYGLSYLLIAQLIGGLQVDGQIRDVREPGNGERGTGTRARRTLCSCFRQRHSCLYRMYHTVPYLNLLSASACTVLALHFHITHPTPNIYYRSRVSDAIRHAIRDARCEMRWHAGANYRKKEKKRGFYFLLSYSYEVRRYVPDGSTGAGAAWGWVGLGWIGID